MNQQMGVTTAFGLAQKKASSLIRDLPKECSITLIHVGERVRCVVEGEEDRHTAAARVESLRCGMGGASITDGLFWIKDYLDRVKLDRAEIYLFSDFQKYTWLRPGGQTAETTQLFNELSRAHETFLVDVGGEPAYNYMLTTLRPQEWVMTTGMPVKFKVMVEAWGKPPEDSKATITFLVDGVKKDVREIQYTGEPVTVTFDHNFTTPGEFEVETVLEGDKHLVDNRRSYLCTVPDRFQVLVLDESAEIEVGGGAMPGAPGIDEAEKEKNKLGWESTYLARAIEPPSHPGLEKVSRFGAKVIHPSMLRFENLDDYPVVALTQISALDVGIVPKLEGYVADGGAVWFFLGPDISQYEYNKHFYKEGEGLLPCGLEAKAEAKATGDGQQRPFLSFGESKHQALAELSDMIDKDAQWLRYWSLTGLEGVRAVLKLSDGKVAVVEKPHGRGRVLLSNSTAGVGWTYLPATMEFPIMVQEMMRYLVGNPDADVNLDAGAVFKQLVFVSTQHLLLRLPDGEKIRLAPKQKEEGVDAWKIEFGGTSQQGLYEFVDVPPGVLPRTRFVVNQKSDEGNLSRLSKGDFRGAFGRGKWEWCGPDKPVEVVAARLHSVTEFAQAILWILAAVLCAESFMAARFGRRRAARLHAVESEDGPAGEGL
jgi:hypothetical protein